MQHRAVQPEGQARRPVSQVGTQVQATELDAGVGLVGLGEGRALGGRVKAAAIELERQMRRGLDLALGLEVAQKRHGKVQRPQLMGLAHGLVDKVQLAADEREVVKGKARGLTGRRIVRGLEARQDVVNVITPPAQVRQRHHRVVHLNRVGDRCQPQQGRQLCI